jgi:DNA-binding transcriptional MerR regulator
MAEQKNRNGDGRLMSIREVSMLTGVPSHTLRFWEKEMPEILQPGRTQGGQRRYDSEMTERVRMIKELSQERKCSLATIRRMIGVTTSAQNQRGEAADLKAERLLDHVVDEIAGLLKTRLLHLLQSRDFMKSGDNQ